MSNASHYTPPLQLISSSHHLSTPLVNMWDALLEVGRGLAYRRDPRVRQYIMQSSCVPVAVAMVAYLALVAYGPRFMKDRKPPQLKRVMTVYNIGQVSKRDVIVMSS